MPQQLGEPICIDEIGGMVLELVGVLARPELAHARRLSNTLADVFKHDSSHAADRDDERGRDHPVFGEVRIVVDEVFLGRLPQLVVQSLLFSECWRTHGLAEVKPPLLDIAAAAARAALGLDAALQSCGGRGLPRRAVVLDRRRPARRTSWWTHGTRG